MADVVVVGASIAGMAAAARLAKLGHHVVVLERRDEPGGLVRRVEQDGFGWDAGPSSITLPAVLRDLFRKSGRPLEKYVDLRLREVARRHVFADASYVDLPTGSRGAQINAIDAGIGKGHGQEWADFVDAQAGVWEVLRRDVLDQPTGGVRLGDRSVARALRASTSLAKALASSLSDTRLREMAAAPFAIAGAEPRDVPAYGTVEAYVERTFGVWEVPRGLAAITAALVTRLAERRVDLRLGCAATSIGTRDGSVVDVRTSAREVIDTSIVVTAIDPREVLGTLVDPEAAPVARRAFAETVAIPPPEVTYLGLHGDVPELPAEVVFHADPMLVLTTRGDAPPGRHAWTIQRRGLTTGDALDALAGRGIDVRSQVVARRDQSPAELGGTLGRSAYGLRWDRPRAYARRAAQQHPFSGLYLIGSSTHPGASISYAAWGAAHAAALIGKPV